MNLFEYKFNLVPETQKPHRMVQERLRSPPQRVENYSSLACCIFYFVYIPHLINTTAYWITFAIASDWPHVGANKAYWHHL